jgi:hypothetical protein
MMKIPSCTKLNAMIPMNCIMDKVSNIYFGLMFESSVAKLDAAIPATYDMTIKELVM